MLTKCRHCGFYVKENDEFCLNCGIKNPTKSVDETFRLKITIHKLLQTEVFKLIFSFFIALTIIYPLNDFASFYFPKFLTLIVILSFIFWGLLFLAMLFVLKSYEIPAPNLRLSKHKNNLNSLTKTIEDRISELDIRNQQIDLILDRIKSTDGKNLLEVRKKLLSAREIVTNQFVRYKLQRQKIELVRLQNSVSPFLFSVDRLNDFETENGLVTIEISKQEINKIRKTLNDFAETEFPVQTINEKRHFLSQLDETENSCEKLREALLSKQAMRALQGIAPIEENLKLPSAKDITHSAETFNLQATLTDFSESFEELEREYRRVRAESEVSRKLLEN